MRDELRDGDEREAVLWANRSSSGAARARAVFVEDLADHAGRRQAGEAREVDRRFGVADALQHAAVARAQREDVPAVDAGRPGRSPDRPRRESSSRDPAR